MPKLRVAFKRPYQDTTVNVAGIKNSLKISTVLEITMLCEVYVCVVFYAYDVHEGGGRGFY